MIRTIAIKKFCLCTLLRPNLANCPKAVLWIRIGFSADQDPAFYLSADPDPAFISVRIRIPGAKPVGIRIRIEIKSWTLKSQNV